MAQANRYVVELASNHKWAVLDTQTGRYVSKPYGSPYFTTQGGAKRSAVAREKLWRRVDAENRRLGNPSALRVQVRRLPSGEVQLKIPLSRNPASLKQAMKAVRKLGRRVKSVVVTGMKRRLRNPGETDTISARELELYVENDAQLYRSQYTPINRNLATKKARGVYDHDKAVKLFMYLMESGAKKYAREYGGPGANWHEMFNVPTRRAAAERFARHFEVEYGLGNYDSLLPKKYQTR